MTIKGIIIFIKDKRTIKVAVSKQKKSRYGKYIMTKRSFAVDCIDSSNLHIGQEVSAIQSRPISKTKFFQLIQ
jgi:ribosomal protein S17